MSKFFKVMLRNFTVIVMCLSITFLESYLESYNVWTYILEHGIEYLIVSLGFILASEITLFFDKKYKNVVFIIKTKKRIIRINKYIIIIATYILIFSIFIIGFQKELHKEKTAILYIIFGAIYVIMFDLILLTKSYYKNLHKERDANTKLKEEKLKSDLTALQSQLNPHFLFNSLNVLVSEIHFNQEKAVQYTQHLSDIYRYVIQSTQNHRVKLHEELKFICSFIYMWQPLLIDFSEDVILIRGKSDLVFSFYFLQFIPLIYNALYFS